MRGSGTFDLKMITEFIATRNEEIIFYFRNSRFDIYFSVMSEF